MKLSLNREQLKLIAIISMIIDHVAWGFVEFYSPLGQFLHVLGRLTIPIMCFFIAEGFRKTSSLRNYINRMLCFGILSIIPFYIFFHEEYGFRTNIIFDLMFGLFALTVLESELKKWQKVLLMMLIFGTSMFIGGWPITPTLFVLIFYYGKSFKQKVLLFIGADVITVAFLVVAISLNSVYHFSHYDWVWWDKFYQLGFMLALPLLYCYNGEKGKPFLSRYFFYFFYPLHFCVLSAVKEIVTHHASAYEIDLWLHIAVLFVSWFLAFQSMRCRPSKGQTAVVFFMISGSVYIFGFIMEIMSKTASEFHLAIMTEYFGEGMCFVSLLYFVHILCKTRTPIYVYVLQIVLSLLIMYGQMTTMENGIFYKSIDVDQSGPFPRPILTYGIGFYLAITYIILLSVYAISVAVLAHRKGNNLAKRRMQLFIAGICLVWLPYPIKLLGLTGGYEIPGVGIALAGICFYLILIRYGFLDTVTLASESVLDHGSDGIVVLGTDYTIQYHNKRLDDIFGVISHNADLREHEEFSKILSGETKILERNDRIYEFNLETLSDNGYEQGYLVWIHDSTEHFESMRQIREIATKDPLTKLYNRVTYQEKIEERLQNDLGGTFVMFDMDNFKLVNDKYGHRAGDEVLKAMADIFHRYDEEKLFACRLGGDEFSAFLPNDIKQKEVEKCISDIMKCYQKRLSEIGFAGCTSLSIGALICDLTRPSQTDFTTIYTMTDKLLYEAKNGGKNQYRIERL